MQGAEFRDFSSPDEVREFENGRIDLVRLADGEIGKITLQPGWRWSRDVKPIAKTESCEVPHFQYQLSGRMHVVMSDGTEYETHAGQVLAIPPKHDAWVVGDEQVVVIDWAGASNYAKRG